MYRRDYGYSRTYRPKRRWPVAEIIRTVVIVLLLVAVGYASVMVHRAFQAQEIIQQLEEKNQSLQAQVDRFSAVIPDPALVNALEQNPLPYQTAHPDLYVNPKPSPKSPPPNTVYLTFDGGPSPITAQVLDVLKQTGQKATFFVTGSRISGNEALLKRMVAEGHTIGILSYSQDYRTVYASVEAFLQDFEKAYQAIYQACGVYPTIFRFPGSSINGYSQGLYPQMIAEMLRRGFVYYDWSVSARDGVDTTFTASQIAKITQEGITKSGHPIVWMHDSPVAKSTPRALSFLLPELTKAGYTCAPLTNAVQAVTFAYSAVASNQ